MTSNDSILLKQRFAEVEDDHSRVVLLDEVANTFRGSNSKAINQFLASVVIDKSHSHDVRLVAYLVLYEVSGRCLTSLPSVPDLKLPDVLDQAFLAGCLS